MLVAKLNNYPTEKRVIKSRKSSPMDIKYMSILGDFSKDKISSIKRDSERFRQITDLSARFGRGK